MRPQTRRTCDWPRQQRPASSLIWLGNLLLELCQWCQPESRTPPTRIYLPLGSSSICDGKVGFLPNCDYQSLMWCIFQPLSFLVGLLIHWPSAHRDIMISTGLSQKECFYGTIYGTNRKDSETTEWNNGYREKMKRRGRKDRYKRAGYHH
ncbi:hypothetical protein BC827DRAFT_514736 [Russula dissimulans]|nr:hypothetical protein BC827DRAFT_514736 [Russula dissimulans]